MVVTLSGCKLGNISQKYNIKTPDIFHSIKVLSDKMINLFDLFWGPGHLLILLTIWGGAFDYF